MLNLFLLVTFFSMTIAITIPEIWSYDPPMGPSTWPGICKFGNRQSPVDICSMSIDHANMEKLQLINYVNSGPVKMENNGKTVIISGFDQWSNNQPFIFGGALRGKYKLLQIHIHWGNFESEGSEHTLCNQHYPVEVHFVHKKEGTEGFTILPSDGLAVIGVFMTIQQKEVITPFSNLEFLLQQLVEPQTSVKISQYSPITILPKNTIDRFYTYEGSLTTPECDEIVIWTILAEPLPITKNQLKFLREIKFSNEHSHHNYRPTQPLNGRRISFRSGA